METSPGWVARWMYRGHHPNTVARVIGSISAKLSSAGLLPGRLVELQVPGRRTGRLSSLPLVVAEYRGNRYLVSMLGQDANWVLNVRAAGGYAVLRHGRRELVHLEEVDRVARGPILRRYLECAPGARPHIPVDRKAPARDFDRICDSFPVFRVTAVRSPEPAGRSSNLLVGQGNR